MEQGFQTLSEEMSMWHMSMGGTLRAQLRVYSSRQAAKDAVSSYEVESKEKGQMQAEIRY